MWGHAKRREQGACQHAGERKRVLWLLFWYVFFLPLGLPRVKWASQECCLFHLRSSLMSWDLPLTFFCSVFSGFSLPCLLATVTWDSCFLFKLLNILTQKEEQTPNYITSSLPFHFFRTPILHWPPPQKSPTHQNSLRSDPHLSTQDGLRSLLLLMPEQLQI